MADESQQCRELKESLMHMQVEMVTRADLQTAMQVTIKQSQTELQSAMKQTQTKMMKQF